MYHNRHGIAVAIACAMVLLLAIGCGSRPGGAETEGSQESPPEISDEAAPEYGLNEPVLFQGGSWTFEMVESLQEIPVRFEDEGYTPENGQYIVISYQFRGDAANNAGGVDQAIYRLVDDQGRSYSMDSDLWNHEVSELSGVRGRSGGLMLTWNSRELKDALLVFDVPADAQGLELHLITAEGGQVKTGARVILGEPVAATE